MFKIKGKVWAGVPQFLNWHIRCTCSTMMKKHTMGRNNRLFSILLFFLVSTSAMGQKIVYSEPEREDNRRTNFEIIGKVGSNILVFKGNRSDNAISVYDNEMKLVERVKLGYMDDRWINVDFVPYPNHAWMIYQFQRKGVVYCMGVKLDGNAKQLSDPVELDTTKIGWAANNKIYTTLFSDDKQKIMVFKVNNRNPKNFIFTTLLFDADMKQQEKHRMTIDMEERNDYFTDFMLDNDGDLVFGKFIRKGGSDYITDLKLIMKKAASENFAIHDLQTKDRVLDEVKIKIDNTNKRYLFTALYYKQKRGNVEGLYTVVWDKSTDKIEREGSLAFDDELRRQAKGPDANLRLAFNDYFINDIIIRKDGGYLLIGESMYTTTRGGTFNRWDYMGWNSPWNSPMDYYYWSPYYSPWRYPWNRWGSNSQASRYHAENIIVLSFDNQDKLQWTNVVTKSQFDDESDALVSYELMNTGGQLHFLFNLYERRTLLLNDHSIGPDGKITRHPTLKNLERGVEFMPRFGKQVSTHSTVVPCLYRNYLTFAKIDF
jgi:hypothetical protein